MCTWSTRRCPSSTVHSFCRANSRSTSPRCCRRRPYNTCPRPLGIQTTWEPALALRWTHHPDPALSPASRRTTRLHRWSADPPAEPPLQCGRDALRAPVSVDPRPRPHRDHRATPAQRGLPVSRGLAPIPRGDDAPPLPPTLRRDQPAGVPSSSRPVSAGAARTCTAGRPGLRLHGAHRLRPAGAGRDRLQSHEARSPELLAPALLRRGDPGRVGGKLHPGNTHVTTVTLALFEEAWAKLPPTIQTVRVRADGAFFDHKLVEWLKSRDAAYVLVARLTGPIKRRLSTLPYQRISGERRRGVPISASGVAGASPLRRHPSPRPGGALRGNSTCSNWVGSTTRPS